MLKVNAIICPKCGDTIYSRAKHDFRNCSCKGCFIDGGLDYIRMGGIKTKNVKVFKLKIEATAKELYDDWNLHGKKYGLIRGKHEIEVCLKKMDTIVKGAYLFPPKEIKCKCNMCKSVEKGMKEVKEGKVTKVGSIEELFKEDKKKRKKYPIYYFFRDLYYRIYRFVERIPLDVKTFIQRGKRGWADSDTWGFCHYLPKVISEGVCHLKENIHGMPPDLTEGQWIDILNKITHTFELARRISDEELYLIKDKKQRNKLQESLDKIDKVYKLEARSDRCMTSKEIREYEEGFDLFKEYLFNLWD